MKKKQIVIISISSIFAIILVALIAYCGFFISKSVPYDDLQKVLSSKSIRETTDYVSYAFKSQDANVKEYKRSDDDKAIFLPENGKTGISDEMCITEKNHYLSPLFNRVKIVDYVISKKSDQPVGVYLTTDEKTNLKTMIFFSDNTEKINKIVIHTTVNALDKVVEIEQNPYYPVLSFVFNLGSTSKETINFVKAEFFTNNNELFYTYEAPKNK